MNLSNLFTTTLLTFALSAMAIVIPEHKDKESLTIDQINDQLITLINDKGQGHGKKRIGGFIPQLLADQPDFLVKSGLSGNDLDFFYEKVNDLISLEAKAALSTTYTTVTISSHSTATSSATSTDTAHSTTTSHATTTTSHATTTDTASTNTRTRTRTNTSNGANNISQSLFLGAIVSISAMIMLQ